MEAINVNWLNENAYRNYPLVDGASRVAASGAVLPNGLLADLSLPVPLGTLAPSDAFIRRVYGFSAGVVITIADVNDASTDLATATVFIADHARNKSYPIVGIPGTVLAGVIGRVSIGLPEAVAQCAGGLFDFAGAPGNTRIVISAVRPLLRGVAGIEVQSADGTVLGALGGTITLKAGDNVTLEVDPVSKAVTVASAVIVSQQDVADAGCGCDASLESDAGAIKTINGVQPDAAGNLTISGLLCVQINPSTSGTGVEISDSCTTPCCGCDQLGQLQSDLQQVENTRSQLSQVAEQLQARISNLSNVVSSAGLNPPSTPPTSVSPSCWWWLPSGPGGYGGSIVPCPA